MTRLSYAARNLLSQVPAVTALLGSSKNWDTWIFSDQPYVRLENKSKSLIVITEDGSWSPPNLYSTQRFPRLNVDVWSDPTRNPDSSVRRDDAKDKIEDVFKQVNLLLHTVDLSDAQGNPIVWGTAEQIADRTGVLIMGSAWTSGIDYSPVSDAPGAFMGRCTYQVCTA